MASRLIYLWTRIRESGVKGVVTKLRQKLKPYYYAPTYYFPSLFGSRISDSAVENLLAFGEQVRFAFAKLDADKSESYERRQIERQNKAFGKSITVLGYGETNLPEGLEWRCDPFHGHQWSNAYFPRCDFLVANKYCDVKVPWEMSRMQWLVWLAEACLKEGQGDTEKQSCQKLFWDTLADWIEFNPAGFGVNWTCGMDVAIRAVNLAIAGSMLMQDWEIEKRTYFAKVLQEHLDYLERFPEVSDIAGNHYLADLMGEAVLHMALNGLKSTKLEHIISKFAEEADIQFEADGCHLERATVYHRLSLEMVSPVLAMAILSKHKALPKLQNVMRRACAFSAQVVSDTGRLPVFGDQDSGFVLWMGECAQLVDKRLCGNLPSGQETDLHSLWAYFSGKPEKYFPEVQRQKTGLKSGFATLSEGNIRVSLKSGEQGLKGRAPHDHDDALSVWLAIGDKDVLVDAGCSSYTLDPKARLASIASSSHNVVVPLNQERFVPVQGSVFATVKGAPIGKVIDIEETSVSACLENILTDGPILSHNREVRFSQENGFSVQLKITDGWVFRDELPSTITWRIHPDFKLKIEASNASIFNKSEKNGARPQYGSFPNSISIIEKETGNVYAKAFVKCDVDYVVNIVPSQFSPDYGKIEDCEALEFKTISSKNGHAELLLEIPVVQH